MRPERPVLRFSRGPGLSGAAGLVFVAAMSTALPAGLKAASDASGDSANQRVQHVLDEAGVAFDAEKLPEGAPIIIEAAKPSVPVWAIVALAFLSTGLAAGVLFARQRGRQEVSGAVVTAPVRPEAYLVDLDHRTIADRHPLHDADLVVGRVSSESIPGYQRLQIRDAELSRQHALIKYEDLTYWVVDQGSVNGTFVNGKRIDGPVALRHGDEVRFHKYRFVLELVRELERGEGTRFDATRAAEAPLDATVAAGAGMLAAELTHRDRSIPGSASDWIDFPDQPPSSPEDDVLDLMAETVVDQQPLPEAPPTPSVSADTAGLAEFAPDESDDWLDVPDEPPPSDDAGLPPDEAPSDILREMEAFFDTTGSGPTSDEPDPDDATRSP